MAHDPRFPTGMPPYLQTVITTVCQVLEVEIEEVMATPPRCTAEIVHARRLCFLFLYHCGRGYTHRFIAQWFGVDDTNVGKGITSLNQNDPGTPRIWQAQMQEIEKRVAAAQRAQSAS